MSTEQRDKDLKFLRVAAQMAEGVEAVGQRVEKARLACLVTDNARLKAHLDEAPPHVTQARAAAHSDARMVLLAVEEHYYEAIQANAEYLRKEAAK